MSFQVDKGLFMLDDFMDCHAILGVAVDADFREIRKRYLKIAQCLHPDTADASVKDLATQLFAKLVGPAYSTLSKERERKEYMLLIQLKGRQAIQQKIPMTQLGDPAQTLANAENLEEAYHQAIDTLATAQYTDLDRAMARMGEISELNLVYLMRRESQSYKASASSTSSPAASSSGKESPSGEDLAETKRSSVDSYLRRAEDYMAKKAYAQAILELRDALRFAPNDSRCHSLMGLVYLQQNQTTMARVSIKRALELDPKDPNALKAKQRLEKLGQTVEPGNAKAKSTASSRGNKAEEEKGGGLFGLFGGGKKK